MKNNKHDAHFNILKIIKFELNKLKLMSLTFTKTYIFQQFSTYKYNIMTGSVKKTMLSNLNKKIVCYDIISRFIRIKTF